MKKRIMALILACSLALSGQGMISTQASGRNTAIETMQTQASEIVMEKVELEDVPVLESVGANVDYYEQEFNNSVAQANEVSLTTTVHASITDNDPVDFYKVTLPAAGALNLTVNSKMKVYTIAVYNEQIDNYIYSKDNTWNSAMQEITNTHTYYLEAGVYYIQMTGCEYFQNVREDYDDYANASTGEYTCTINYVQSSLTEVENIVYGTPVRGQLSWCGENEDVYKFVVAETGIVNFKITSWINDYSFGLYSSSRNSEGKLNECLYWREDIGIDSDDDKSENSVDWYLEPGEYYFFVENNNSDRYASYRGLYEFNMTYTRTAQSFTGSDQNASEANVVALNTTYTGQLSLTDSSDLYTFTINASRDLPIHFTTNAYDYKIEIFDSNGKSIWNHTPYGSSGDKVEDYNITLAADTYYMQVSSQEYYSYGYRNSTGIYTFNISAGNISSLQLDKTTLSLMEGLNYQLKPIMKPKSVPVAWSSNNPSVATADNGNIIAKGAGTAVITCSALDGSGKQATCTVTVTKKPIPYTELKMSVTNLVLKKNEVYQLGVTKVPADVAVAWASSNPAIVSVENGKVTAKNFGTATITCSALNGSGKAVTCTVAVSRTPITQTNVDAVATRTYTGKAIKPSVAVTYNGSVLKKGTDYTVSYKNNKNIGTATITVTGKGNYSGTKKITFKIIPQKVSITSAKVSKKKAVLTWKKQKSASGYEIYMSSKKSSGYKKVKTIKKASVTKYTSAVLKKGTTRYFKVRSYKTVSGKKWYGNYSSVKKIKR